MQRKVKQGSSPERQGKGIIYLIFMIKTLNCFIFVYYFQENIKRRFPLVKYAVGLIMMHKKINVNGLQIDRLVVIHAWYYRPRQPVIYNVLFNNGNICDVKEGNFFYSERLALMSFLLK